MTWTRVASVSDLSGEGPFALSADGVDLIAVHTADGWRAEGPNERSPGPVRHAALPTPE